MVRPDRDRLTGRVEVDEVDETYLGGLEEGVTLYLEWIHAQHELVRFAPHLQISKASRGRSRLRHSKDSGRLGHSVSRGLPTPSCLLTSSPLPIRKRIHPGASCIGD